MKITILLAFIALTPLGSVPAEDEANEELLPCAGCADTSAAPTVDNSDAIGGNTIDATVTNMNGACFLLPSLYSCNEADPCTPILKIAATAPSAAATATGRGVIGPVGTGTIRVEWGLFEGGDTKTLYEDYVGVGCGSSTGYSYGVSWNLLPSGTALYGTSSCSGLLTCTACAD